LNLGHLDFDIVSNFVLRISYFSYRDTNFPSTSVEDSLQISPFMQNKANFPKSQMNVTNLLTTNYEQLTMNYVQKNKANTKPNKANTKPIQTQSNPISPAHKTTYDIRHTQYEINSWLNFTQCPLRLKNQPKAHIPNAKMMTFFISRLSLCPFCHSERSDAQHRAVEESIQTTVAKRP